MMAYGGGEVEEMRICIKQNHFSMQKRWILYVLYCICWTVAITVVSIVIVIDTLRYVIVCVSAVHSALQLWWWALCEMCLIYISLLLWQQNKWQGEKCKCKRMQTKKICIRIDRKNYKYTIHWRASHSFMNKTAGK